MPETLTIGEAAALAGVAASTLRYYERVGLLPRAPRVSGRRRYTDDVVTTMRLIALAQEAGFTISEIRTLLSGFDRGTPPSERWQAMARTKLTEVRARIDRARRMEQLLHSLLRCRCVRMDDCARFCAPAPPVRIAHRRSRAR